MQVLLPCVLSSVQCASPLQDEEPPALTLKPTLRSDFDAWQTAAWVFLCMSLYRQQQQHCQSCLIAHEPGIPLQLCFWSRSMVPACPQDSLGGNARTTLIVAVADAAESAQETLDSLTFGEHTMQCLLSQAQQHVGHCFWGLLQLVC